MEANKLITYLERVVDINIDTLKALVYDCQVSSQLDVIHEGVSPLCVACSTDCLAAVDQLLKAGAGVDIPCGYFDKSPLHYCVANHEEEDDSTAAIATLLLDYGADVNIKNSKEWSPLHTACQSKNEECVEILIRNGARLNDIDDQNETPLIKACKSYSHGVIEKLVLGGCDINYDFGAALKLLLKSSHDSLKSIKLLVNKGANLKVQNYLCTVCSHSNKADLVEYLISEGADVNDCGNLLNITALHHACISPKVGHGIVELLLQHGAYVNAVSDTGDSALHYACQAASLQKVLVLLNWGASIQCIDECKFTPLAALLTTRVEDSLFRDYMRIAKLLLAAGASLSDSELDSLQKVIPVPLSPSETEQNIGNFLDGLRGQCRIPRKLMDICRIKVRSNITGRKDVNVKELFLPAYLKELLMFSDIYVYESVEL